MAEETWYRGEGVGVPPGKPGGNLSDFGDGLYLTDGPAVAEIYAARRAVTSGDKLVLVVRLQRGSLGMVLDLSLDARWQLFMNDKTERLLLGKSRMQYLQTKHELYAQFFKEFLTRYKIDIKSYDAVIGPEYTTGGRQLCILHKNGLATKLQERVRALFRLVAPSGTKAPVADGAKPGPSGNKAPATAGLKPGPVQLPKPGTRTINLRAGLRTAVRYAGAVGVQAILIYASHR